MSDAVESLAGALSASSSWLAFPQGVNQIGVVVRSVDRTVEKMTGVFGIGPWDVMDMTQDEAVVRGKPTVVQGRFAFAQFGPVQIELIEPVAGPSIYDEHLDTKGEGLHHLGFLVPDFEERVAEMERRGIAVLQGGRTGRHGGFAYLDTIHSAGIIFEYLKATSGLLRYFDYVKHLGDAK